MRDDHQTPDVEIGSDHIVADLGLEDADELSICPALGIQVMKTIREKELYQKEVGKLLRLKQPDLSAIKRATFRRFSHERLIGLLNKREQNVISHLTRHRTGECLQYVTVAP